MLRWLRVTSAQDCCGKKIIDWVVSTSVYYKETVQNVMLGAVEKRFGRQLPSEQLERLADNGSAYKVYETRALARMLGLKLCMPAVRSPESSGIAEKVRKDDKVGLYQHYVETGWQ